MASKKLKYLWATLLMLFLLLGSEGNPLFLFLKSRPGLEWLDFCQPLLSASESRPLVLSTDESINVKVFEKAHPAVVNIVTTTLGMNFWLEIIPKEGQGSGFIIDR